MNEENKIGALKQERYPRKKEGRGNESFVR